MIEKLTKQERALLTNEMLTLGTRALRIIDQLTEASVEASSAYANCAAAFDLAEARVAQLEAALEAERRMKADIREAASAALRRIQAILELRGERWRTPHGDLTGIAEREIGRLVDLALKDGAG